MLTIQRFTFNPFQENTYLVHDDRHALLIDPGCWNTAEEEELAQYLTQHALEPIHCINTHAHLDHIFGNSWAIDRFGIPLHLHPADLELLRAAPRMAEAYGLRMEPSPEPTDRLMDGGSLSIGPHKLKVIHAPGHSPGHVVLYCPEQRFVIGGDVLFQGSIGRTDLPLGDHEELIRSIRERLLTLPDDVIVHCGHGPATTIGQERRSNPFLN
ncbi:MAG: MBL fold metallo-hydrolase [Flavobacteriales bacterium]|nr:MBL fold metallo-hydrolase [Flavobacteriales bacterium]